MFYCSAIFLQLHLWLNTGGNGNLQENATVAAITSDNVQSFGFSVLVCVMVGCIYTGGLWHIAILVCLFSSVSTMQPYQLPHLKNNIYNRMYKGSRFFCVAFAGEEG